MGGESQQLIIQRGIPIMPYIPGLPFTQGNIWHVKPYSGSDSNYGDHHDSAYKTLSQAHTSATADQNDIVLLYAESNTAAKTSDYQKTALTWSKDAVHLVGVGGGGMSMIGQRARISQDSSVLTIADLFTLSANNCLIHGIEVFQGVSGATASTSRAMVVSGTRNRISNCQISGIGHLDIDDAASCSLTVTGDENYFVSNYIGLDTVLRTTSGSEVYITGATRNIFDGCIINSYTANTSFKAITWGASTAHSATWLIDCMFCAEQNRTGVAVPTGALLFGASGQVFMRGGGVYGYADVSTLANANILMLANWGLQTASNFPGIAQGVLPS